MRKLVVEHALDQRNGAAVSRIRVPRDDRVDETGVEERRVVLPVRAAQRCTVEDGVAKVTLVRAMLEKVPAEAEDVVVAEVRAGPIPREQSPVGVPYRAMPRQQPV